MDGTYSELRDLAVNQDFIAKLAVACADTAITVYTEDPATAGHAERAAYATQVVKAPENYAKQMVWAIVLLAADDADATLAATVLSVWDVFAGI